MGCSTAGIGVLAVKPGRIGPKAAAAVARAAAGRGAGRVLALFGEGPLGAAQMVRAAALSDYPIEAGFHLGLSDPLPVEGLTVSDGRIRLPAGRLSEMVDAGALARRAVAGARLGMGEAAWTG